MNVQQQQAKKIGELLARLIKTGGITLTAEYECLCRRMECKIDSTWDFHGVKILPDSISFIAKKEGQPPIQFMAKSEHCEAFLRWLKNIEASIQSLIEGAMTAIEKTIVFLAGVVQLEEPSMVAS